MRHVAGLPCRRPHGAAHAPVVSRRRRRNSRDRPGPVGGACAEREDHCDLLRRRRGGVLGRRPHRRAPRHRDRAVARRPRVPPLHVVGPDHAAAGVAAGACAMPAASAGRSASCMMILGGPGLSILSHAGFILAPLGHGAVIQPSTATLGGLLLATLILREHLSARAHRRRADDRRRPRADGGRRADQHRHACARRRHAVHRGRAVLGLDADAAAPARDRQRARDRDHQRAVAADLRAAARGAVRLRQHAGGRLEGEPAADRDAGHPVRAARHLPVRPTRRACSAPGAARPSRRWCRASPSWSACSRSANGRR